LSKYPLELIGDGPVNLLSSVSVSGGEVVTSARWFDDLTDGLDEWWVERVGLTTVSRGLVVDAGANSGFAKLRFPSNLDESSEFTASVRIDTTPQGFLDGRVSLAVGLPEGQLVGPSFRVELEGIYDSEPGSHQFKQTLRISVVQIDGTNEDRRNVLKTFESDESLGNATLSVRVFPGNSGGVSLSDPCGNYNYASTDPEGLPLGERSGSFLALGLRRGLVALAIANQFSLDYSATGPSVFPVAGSLLVAASNGILTLQKSDGEVQAPNDRLAERVRPLMGVDMIAPANLDADGRPVPDHERTPGPRFFIADYGENAAPKVYDPAANALSDWESDIDDRGISKGTVPLGNTMLARFGGRLYLAGNPPHQWYASRFGNPFDWYFGANVANFNEDPTGATSSQAAEMSVISEPLRALAPFVDDYMVFGTANRLFRLTGDPGLGGRIISLSTEAGIAGPQAWCMTPEGALVLLDQERGLFALSPGAQSFPESLSFDVLPRELRDIDTRDVIVQLAYDHRKPGVHIILNSTSGRSLVHWWYDRPTGGFWPFSLDDGFLPSSILSYQSTAPDRSGVLLGCRDGFVRRFDNPAPFDDGTAFPQHVVYGPFNLAGGDYMEGVLRWIRGTVVPDGADLEFEVLTGPTAHQALDDSSPHQRRFRGGLSSVYAERKSVGLRGVVAYVKLIGNGLPWAVETLDASIEPLAAIRA
jgi:hypothetical protein